MSLNLKLPGRCDPAFFLNFCVIDPIKPFRKRFNRPIGIGSGNFRSSNNTMFRQGFGISEVEIKPINGYPCIPDVDVCTTGIADNDIKGRNHIWICPRICFQSVDQFPVTQQFDSGMVFSITKDNGKADERDYEGKNADKGVEMGNKELYKFRE